ncbi:MAG: hypothetical protein WDO15_29720 [Bacteroidota bacterium]
MDVPSLLSYSGGRSCYFDGVPLSVFSEVEGDSGNKGVSCTGGVETCAGGMLDLGADAFLGAAFLGAAFFFGADFLTAFFAAFLATFLAAFLAAFLTTFFAAFLAAFFGFAFLAAFFFLAIARKIFSG